MKDNKLIAEFMGLTYGPDNCRINKYNNIKDSEGLHVKYTLFHFSWDWLMPVVDKIYGMDEYIKYIRETSGQFENKIEIYTNSVKRTLDEVIEFIKWYNKQRKN